MKKLAVVFVLLAALALTACSSGPQAQEPTDFGWVKFEVPNGFVQVNDKDSRVAISTSEESDVQNIIIEGRVISICPETHEFVPDAETFVSRMLSKFGDHYTDAGSASVGGLEWHLAALDFDRTGDSTMGCADIDGDFMVYFYAYRMSFDDPDLQTVLSSIEVDTTKMPSSSSLDWLPKAD